MVGYLGGISGDKKLRIMLTRSEMNEDETELVYPSISKQKGKNCAICTEMVAISHNLWLMTGATSYFCYTNCDNLDLDNVEYKNDAHNFTIVEYDNKFRLYDVAMGNYCMLDNDCIESLLSGKGLEVKNVKNPGVYAPKDIPEKTVN